MKEKQQKTSITQEIEKLRAAGRTRTSNLFHADDFCVDIRLATAPGTRREHFCSEDEFTYILSGSVDMKVEGVINHLEAGDAFMVKAGVEHVMLPSEGASWLLVSKPHRHYHADD